tara:strand:+ start:107 stop:463 length:357 start_codon:yes stop_codon:yes gene_type:complete
MNNFITQNQWDQIIEAFRVHCDKEKLPKDVAYIGEEKTIRGEYKKHRQFIYDNYDRHTSPGLDFFIPNGWESGKLYVYSGSEQVRAPISFEQGLEIAKCFFSYKGTVLSENIVYDWMV